MSRLKAPPRSPRMIVCLRCAHWWEPAATSSRFPERCFTCGADHSWLTGVTEFYRLDRIVHGLHRDPRVQLRRLRGVRGRTPLLGLAAADRSRSAAPSPRAHL